MSNIFRKWLRNQIKNSSPIGVIAEQLVFNAGHKSQSREELRKSFEIYVQELKNKDACIITAREVGFFSSFLQVIAQIKACDLAGVKPFVYFNNRCLYWQDDGYFGENNAWEYYFKPISDIKLSEIVQVPDNLLENMTSDEIASKVDADCVLVSNAYLEYLIPEVICSKKKSEEIHSIIKNNICINSRIEKKINEFHKDNFEGHHVLGVHLRGIERYEDLHFMGYGHLSIEYYFKQIDLYLKHQPDAIIFAASDSNKLLDKVKERYGSRVIQTNAFRSANEFGKIHLTRGKASLGEEVLIDSVLLSKCNYLIHGISNVSSAAVYFNPEIGHENVYKKYRLISLFKWLFAYKKVENS
jgi:hypothetical protein